MIPYVLGFTPADSLVLVALVGPRKQLGPCLRLDLPQSAEDGAAQAHFLVSVARAHHFSAVLLVAFTADSEWADQVMQPLRRGLALRRIKVVDALRADGRRWWSYTCHDVSCCSRSGTPYDTDSARVAAEAVLAGLNRAPNRDSLRTGLEPLREPVLRATAQECAEQAAAHAAGELPPPRLADLDRLMLRHRGAPGEMPVADTATLLLALQQVALRDAAWAKLSRSSAGGHLELWRHVMRAAPDALLAPPGALTGFAAWLAGQGALAWHAVDRVESVSPGYPMCRLLRSILGAAVSPVVWERMAVQGDPAS